MQKLRFTGTLEQLKTIVDDAGCRGRWFTTPDNRERFIHDQSGAGLNWAPSTGSLWFDGRRPLADSLHDRIELGVMSWHVAAHATEKRTASPYSKFQF